MESKPMQHDIIIRKASGAEEVFDIEKLERSLHNAGADRKTIKRVSSDIQQWIYPGISTKKIYSRAFSLLKKHKTRSSIRYRLKKAILELGPTGYPFEQYMGQLFQRQGFATEVGIIVEGHCLSHEMDVIATKNAVQHIMECKYHADQGKTVSIQVPLYVRSRVDDIIRMREQMEEYKNLSFNAWVVTNTRFSEDSIQYGKCMGMKLLAWDYPYGHGLKDLIEELKVYPITILSQLLISEKRSLMDQGVVTCAQLLSNLKSLDALRLNPRKHKALLKELHDICG